VPAPHGGRQRLDPDADGGSRERKDALDDVCRDRETAHRVVGYFEEEAVISYTTYLEEIDSGRSPDRPAPDIAKHYWKLSANATLRDVVIAVRADEAHHRDVNHEFASKLANESVDRADIAPYPPHADETTVPARRRGE
jgi:ubiquinol oxidase